jgi:hypothetical protein
MLKNTQ